MKQLEIQRREQQKRAASGGGMPSPSFLSSGGYTSVPRFEPTPPSAVSRSESPAVSSLRPPAFKGSGMKLGSKKKAAADLADIIGDEPEEVVVSPPPSAGVQGQSQVTEKMSNLPVVVHERSVPPFNSLRIFKLSWGYNGKPLAFILKSGSN